MLYTFILVYKDGIYCKQILAKSVNEGLRIWCDSLGGDEDFDNEMRLEVLKEIEEDGLDSFMTDTVNLWCKSFLIKDKIGLLHVIKTVSNPET